MSTSRDVDTEREQREWERQESAVRAERSGAPSPRDGDDEAIAQYRLVARALGNPPLDPVPAQFAAQTAARAERSARGAGERVELWLERGLMVLLLLAGIAALIRYPDVALRMMSFSMPERAAVGLETVATWGFAIALCVGLTSALASAHKR